jgi:phage terminase large subunit-like protein
VSRKRGKTTSAKLTKGRVTATASPEILRVLARRQQHVEEARHDVNAFIEYVMKDDDGVTPIHQGTMHREWHALADQHKRLMIIAPRHHGKTFQSVGRAMFKIGRNTNELIKFICASDKKAIKRLASIRTYMKDSPELHRVFPHLHIDRAVEWNKHMITLERTRKAPEPTIEALGITSSGTGDRATGLLVDDAVDRRNSITLPRTRETIKESWDDWYNLLGHDSWMLWISTLWHNSDLTHELMANPEYAVIWYEINGETFGSLVRYPDKREVTSDEPLWPARWGKHELAERKRVLKSRGFARSFSNRPMADSEMRVDPEWINFHRVSPADDWVRVISLDLASSQSPEADYTGVVIFAIHPERPRIKVEDAFHVKTTFPGKAELVCGLFDDYEPEYVVVERAAGGIELGEYLIKKHGIPVVGVKAHGASKAVRLEATTPFLEAGVVTFAPHLEWASERHDDHGDLITELLRFPLYKTDDLVDAFTHGLRFITVAYEHFDDEDEYEDDEDTEERTEDDDPDGHGERSQVLLV